MKVEGLGFAPPLRVSESNGPVLPESHIQMGGWLVSDYDKNIFQLHLLGIKVLCHACIFCILLSTFTQLG